MVYVAGTAALAALEMAVHLNRSTVLPSFVLLPCEFDESLVLTLPRADLPTDWRRDPAPLELAAIGDTWAKQAESAVLAVPSAVIEQETNFLLNPGHADFPKITLGAPQAFEFDPRLIK